MSIASEARTVVAALQADAAAGGPGFTWREAMVKAGYPNAAAGSTFDWYWRRWRDVRVAASRIARRQGQIIPRPVARGVAGADQRYRITAILGDGTGRGAGLGLLTTVNDLISRTTTNVADFQVLRDVAPDRSMKIRVGRMLARAHGDLATLQDLRDAIVAGLGNGSTP